MTKPATADISEPSVSSRRRWLPRFRLRTLLLLLVFAAVPLGFVAKRLHYARRQAAVVEAVKRLDGWAAYDYQVVAGASRAKPSPWATRLPFLGVDFFHDLVTVNVAPRRVYSIGGMILSDPHSTPDAVFKKELDRRPPDDALCERLRGMTGLKSLTLDMQNTTNASLKAISTLDGLEELELIKLTRTHDVGLLGSFLQLKTLSIHQPDLSGSAIARLALQPNLETIQVHFAFKLNELCGALSKHPSLNVIDFSRTYVDDDGVQMLAACASLQHLHLQQTKVTGNAFAVRDNWPRLQGLDLSMCLVTDETLRFVARLPALQSLTAYRNSITREGLRNAIWSESLIAIQLDCDPPSEDDDLRPFVNLPHLKILIFERQNYIGNVLELRETTAEE